MKKLLIFSLLFFGLSHTNLYPSLEITLRRISGTKSSNDTKPTKCVVIRNLLTSAAATSQNTAYNNPLLFPHSEYLDAKCIHNERGQKGAEHLSLTVRDYEDFPSRR